MLRVLLGVLIGVTALRAAPFFSTFGAGNSYSSSSLSLDSIQIAISFVPTVTEVLQSANVEASGSNLNLEIMANSSDGPSGTALDSMSTNLTSNIAYTTLTSLDHPVLVAGDEYWIVLSGNASLNYSVASYNLATENGAANWGSGWDVINSGSSQLPVVNLNGTPVSSTPEPSTFGLAFAAIAVLGARPLRGRFGSAS